MTDPKNVLENNPEESLDDKEVIDAEITNEERELLDKAGDTEPGDDETELESAQLDNTDEDGDPLNENIDVSGDDLDVPGSDTDDDDRLPGEEDEENNSYSLSDQEDAEEPEV